MTKNSRQESQAAVELGANAAGAGRRAGGIGDAQGNAQGARSNSDLHHFHAGMDDDFNTAQGIAALYDLGPRKSIATRISCAIPKLINPTVKGALIGARDAFDRLMGVLGLVPPLEGPEVESKETIDQVERRIARRRELRAARDYAGADAIRDEMKRLGVIVEDHPQGNVWRREGRLQQ